MHPDYPTGCYSSHCIFILISVFRWSRCDFEPNDQPWRTEPLSWDTESQNLLTDKLQLMDQFKQNRPNAAHTIIWMPASSPLLVMNRRELLLFLAYSDSQAIPKRKVENRKTKNGHPKNWIRKSKAKNRITEEFESNIKLTRYILHWQLQQIFSHQDLCGELEQQQNNLQTTWKSNIKILFTIALLFYRDITNKTTMEIKRILSSCSRVIPTTSNGCGQ